MISMMSNNDPMEGADVFVRNGYATFSAHKLNGSFNSLAADVDVSHTRIEPEDGDCFLIGTVSRGGKIGCAYGLAYRDGAWRVSYGVLDEETGLWSVSGSNSLSQISSGDPGGRWRIFRTSVASEEVTQGDGSGDLFGGASRDGASIATNQINRNTTSADSRSDDHVPVIVAQGCQVRVISYGAIGA